LSILTFLLVTYLFLIFPYCCLGRGKDSKLTEPMGPEGMMVLPVQHLPGGSKHKGSKGKKKHKKGVLEEMATFKSTSLSIPISWW
jgi:hypothetical protein